MKNSTISKIMQLAAILVLCLSTNSIFALALPTTPTDSTPVVAPPPPPPVPLVIAGSVDAYFRYGFNKTASTTSFTSSHNTFALGWANIIVSKDGATTGFVADLAFGQRANEFNYVYTKLDSSGRSQALSVIKQAYVYWKASKDVKFTLGSFNTHLGYEVPEATTNLNYSMSYMFSYGPFYHTGLKMDYTLSPEWNLMVGLFDDTDTKYGNTNGLHLGGQLSYQKGDIKAFFNVISGSDYDATPNDPNVHTGTQLDLVVNYQASKTLALGLNATSKSITIPNTTPSSASWSGLALYANLATSDAVTLALRGEYFSDKDGVNLGIVDGTGTSVTGITLSANIKTEALTFIPEFRFDSAGKNIFTDSNNKATSAQASFLLAAVYKF
jgi:Putative beta-barrel porin-2, OmpL-like. bbp2